MRAQIIVFWHVRIITSAMALGPAAADEGNRACHVAIRSAASLLADRFRVPFCRGYTVMRHDHIAISALRVLLGASVSNANTVVDELVRVIANVSTSDPRMRMQGQLCLLRVLCSCVSQRFRVPGGWQTPPPLDAGTVDRALTLLLELMRPAVEQFNSILFSLAESWQTATLVGRHEERIRAFVSRALGREHAALRDGEATLVSEQPVCDQIGVVDRYVLFVLQPQPPTEAPPVWLEGSEVRFDCSQWSTPADVANPEPFKLRVCVYRNCANIIFGMNETNCDRLYPRFVSSVNKIADIPTRCTPEMRLPECCGLRLSQLLMVVRDIAAVTIAHRNQRPSLASLLLRRAVIAWAYYHGDELAELYGTGSSAFSSIFDMLISTAESSRRRMILSPVLAGLLTLCPEAIMTLAQHRSRREPSVQKKCAFFDQLRAQIMLRNCAPAHSAVLFCRIAAYSNVPALEKLAGVLGELVVARQKDMLRTGTYGRVDSVISTELIPALMRTGHSRMAVDLATSCIPARNGANTVAHAISILAPERHFSPPQWREYLYPACAPALRAVLRNAATTWGVGDPSQALSEALSEQVAAVTQAAVFDECLLWHSIAVPVDREAEQIIAGLAPDNVAVYQRDSIGALVLALIKLTTCAPAQMQLVVHSLLGKLAKGSLFLALHHASLPPQTVQESHESPEMHNLLALVQMTNKRDLAVASKHVLEASSIADRRHWMQVGAHAAYRLYYNAETVTEEGLARELHQAALIVAVASVDEEVLDTSLTLIYSVGATHGHLTPWFADMCREIIAHVSRDGFPSALPRMCAYIGVLEDVPASVSTAWLYMYHEWERLTPSAATQPDALKQWANYTQFLVAGVRGASQGTAVKTELHSHVLEFAGKLAVLLLGDSGPVSASIMQSLHEHVSAPLFVTLVTTLDALLPASGPLPALDAITCVLALLDVYYSQMAGVIASEMTSSLFVCVLVLLPINGDQAKLSPARLHACSVLTVLLGSRALDDTDRAVILRIILIWIDTLDVQLRDAALPLLEGLTRNLVLARDPWNTYASNRYLPCIVAYGSFAAHMLLRIGCKCVPEVDVAPVVSALANILVANDETLLREAENLVMSDSDVKRAIAMRALAIAWPRVVADPRRIHSVALGPLEKIIELMAADKFAPMLTLCREIKTTEFALLEHLVFVLMRRRRGIIPLIRAAVVEEVCECENPDMLMRSNTARVHLISTYLRQSSFFFVKGVVEVVIKRLMSLPEDAFDMDPAREDGGDAGRVNIMEFMDWVLEMCHSMMQYLSPLVRTVCRDVYTQVAKRFTERHAPQRALCGLVLLRVVCPTLMNPASVGVSLPAGRASLQRELVLVNKMSLAIGQGSLPPHRDEHLQPLNAYIASCAPKVTEAVQRLCSIVAEPTEGLEPGFAPSGAFDAAYLHEGHQQVHTLLAAHAETLQAMKPEIVPLLNAIAPVRWSERMAALGTTGTLQRVLQRQRSSLDTGMYEHIVYVGPLRPRPVIHYIMRHMVPRHIDYILFISQLQRCLVACAHEPFDVLVDMTGVENESFMSQDAMALFLVSASGSQYQNLRTMFFLNMSSTAFEKLSCWGLNADSNPIIERAGSNGEMRFVAGSTRAELDAFFDPGAYVLPSLTKRILDNTWEPIGSAVLEGNTTPHVPVNLYVMDELLITRSVQPLSLAMGIQCHATDLYLLSDIIVDAYDASCNIMRLLLRSRGCALWLYGYDVYQMALSLRDAQWKSQRRKSTDASITLSRRTCTTSSLLPLMIGSSLWHLASLDPLLRTAAHDLLASAFGSVISIPESMRVNPAIWMVAVRSHCDVAIEKLCPSDACTAIRVLVDTIIQDTDHAHGADLAFLAALVPHFSTYARENPVRVRRVIHEILGLHIQFSMLRPSLHRYFWARVRKCKQLSALLVSVCIEVVPVRPSPGVDGVLDAVAVVASRGLHNQLLYELRHALSQPPPAFCDAYFWHRVQSTALLHAELCAALDADYVLTLLPDIAWISLVLAHNASDVLCHAAQRTLTQAVYTLSEHATLGRASGSRTAAFGFMLGADEGRLFRAKCTSDSRILTHSVQVVLRTAAPSREVYLQWRARLVSLATSTAFQPHNPLRPRGLQLLGHLAEGTLDDDLVYQVLYALVAEMRTGQAVRSEAVMYAVLECLRDLCVLLPSTSYFLPQLFWTGVAVAACEAPSPLCVSALGLATAALDVITTHTRDDKGGAVVFLLSARDAYSAAARSFDRESGVSFDHNFSFALVTLLREHSWGDLCTDLHALLARVLQCADLVAVESKAELGAFAMLYLADPCMEHLDELLVLARATPETCESWRKNAHVLCAPLVSDGTMAMLVALVLSRCPYMHSAAQVECVCATIAYMCNARPNVAKYLAGDARECLEHLLERPGLDPTSYARVLDTLLCLVASAGAESAPGSAAQYFMHTGFSALAHPQSLCARDAAVSMLVRMLDVKR